VLVVSDAVRRAAVAAGYVEPERIRVVPNWCDDRSVLANGAEPRPAFCGEGRYVLFLGGTSVFKGAHALVDIWRDHAPAANLVMVGSPDQSFDRTLPPRVQVVGYQPSEQVAAAIASAEMVVVATQGPDACPGVAIEATTLGVPTIGTFVGGIPEIVRDGINGFTFEVGDLASMGAAITEILGNAQLRSRLSEGARSVAPDYSSTTVVNQIEAAFERAVARATRKAQGEPVAAQAASRSRTYTTSGEIGSEPPSTTSVT
jgi:glycosyltransferase involved in cell wall biosynthesis